MNNLLPGLEELKPYVNKEGFFKDCLFKENFNSLSFLNKLQTINDIIRQTILVDPYPNPNNHTTTLIGDCYTASLIAIEYLKNLNIGKNHRCVLCRKRKYDPSDIVSKHIAILLDDEQGKTYFFDASPFVSSKYGTVSEFEKDNFYEEYTTLDEHKLSLIFFLKELAYKDYYKKINLTEIPFYINILNEALSFKSLNGLTSSACIILSKYLDSRYDSNKMLSKSAALDPFNKFNDDYLEKKSYRNLLIKKQIALWQTELNDLLKSNTNFKRQLELAQNIYRETKNFNKDLVSKIVLENKEIRLSNMTPRFFLDNNLKTLILSQNTNFLLIRNKLKEQLLTSQKLYQYSYNLSTPTPTNITPNNFINHMGLYGDCDVVLYKHTNQMQSEKISIQKQRRQDQTTQIKQEAIQSNTKILEGNSPVESSLLFLSGHPEQQVMTSFMYPNPKLSDPDLSF